MTTPISPQRVVNDLPSLSSPRISPDGKTIAYVRGLVNVDTGLVESAIWFPDGDGTNRRRVTWASPTNSSPAWSPDGNSLAFVTSREDKTALAVLNVRDGAEARIVTQHAVSIVGISWSPDGSTIAYAAPVDPDNPNETPRDPKAAAAVRVVSRIDYKQDGYGYLNDVRTQIFVVDVDAGDRRQLTRETADHLSPTWSSDGTRLAIQLPHHNGLLSRLGILDVVSGDLVEVGAENIEVANIRWTPDETGLLYSQSSNIEPAESWHLYDLGTGTSRRLTEDVEFMAYGDISGTGWLDAKRAVVHGFLHGRTGLWSLDIDSGALVQLAHPLWIGWESDIDGGENAAILAMTSLEGVVGLVRIDLANGKETLLFDEATDFNAEMPVPDWEAISIERNGYTIDGWLFKPADFDPGKRYPLVLDVHGGPHGFYGYTRDSFGEVLATNGLLVLKSNPRGSGAYGPDFAKAVIGDWGGEDWLDLQAILDLVIARPYVDAERTGIYGYSYGGYMSSWAIGQTTRFKAAIIGAPVFDLESFFGTSDVGHIFGSQGYMQVPWENRDATLARSPSQYIQNATTPTLVIHGEADDRCPIGQGEHLFISLKMLGVETEFARYPGGSHGFPLIGPPAHRIDLIARSLAWFKKHLGEPS